MKNEPTINYSTNIIQYKELSNSKSTLPQLTVSKNRNGIQIFPPANGKSKTEILCITSYPPRECGLATYSHDLVQALKYKFENSFSINICALEEHENYGYSEDVKYILNTTDPKSYSELANSINSNPAIGIILVQHEFGFFNKQEEKFRHFLYELRKPVVVVFHTVLPQPDELLKAQVHHIAAASASVVVMTNNSAQLLTNDYNIHPQKITVIPHGTHLVQHLDKDCLKEKYGLKCKKVLSTFGLLSSGKGIETTLESLPVIIKTNPDVVFLIIGKTHPTIVKYEGEKYRDLLEKKVEELDLKEHVQFINKYMPLPELLEYLQLTDIYLFTSKDPNQAVSGTFSYAISCGCPIISTPIPHAKELLRDDAGLFIQFGNTQQLSEAVNRLLYDEKLRKNISLNGLHRIAPTSWENAAIAHATLFEKINNNKISLQYSLPSIKLDHIKKMTTDFGMIQFSKINQPDPDSGYTLDDNARALIAMCQHYELTRNKSDFKYINIYFNFIKHCLSPEGYFLNYVNYKGGFTNQNNITNLADANGRAIWALGYVVSIGSFLPKKLVANAEDLIKKLLTHVNSIHSTRAMGFIIKGLYYYKIGKRTDDLLPLQVALANRLVQMYKHESDKGWEWFESYLTYANGILPEAMLYTYLSTGDITYKEIAKDSFDFLLLNTFNGDGIKVVSNKGWLRKGEKAAHYGEQPIDVAYTIFALSKFYEVFKHEDYFNKMKIAFSWFLGHNHLHQIIYNPCTGGCYDGLEENHVNLNQGAESTVSYLIARLTVEKYFNKQKQSKPVLREYLVSEKTDHMINV